MFVVQPQPGEYHSPTSMHGEKNFYLTIFNYSQIYTLISFNVIFVSGVASIYFLIAKETFI